MSVIRVLLVDDHDLVCIGIRSLLEQNKHIKVMGIADSGEAAIKFVREKAPDVVLMDVEMPGMGGLEATRRMLRYCPSLRIIMLSAHTEEPYPSSVLKAGAMGYLTKNDGPEQMLKAIEQVHRGERYLTPEIAMKLALGSVDGIDKNPFKELSERETQVMLMITSGQKVQEISDKLCLSPKTVNTYRYRLFDKLKVKSDVELTHLAMRYRMLDAGPAER